MKENPSSHSSKHVQRAVLFMAALSVIGLADSLYLYAYHLKGTLPYCALIEGCDLVLSGEHALLFGAVPLALLGVLYYGLFFLLTIGYLSSPRARLLRLLYRLPIVGLIASVWFIYLQVVVIGALCEYCLLSALTSTLLFLSGIFILVTIHGENAHSRQKNTSRADGELPEETLSR